MLVWEEYTASGIKQLFAPVKREKSQRSIRRNMLKNAEARMTVQDWLVIIVSEIMELSAETSAELTQNCTDMFTACEWNQRMFQAVL